MKELDVLLSLQRRRQRLSKHRTCDRVRCDKLCFSTEAEDMLQLIGSNSLSNVVLRFMLTGSLTSTCNKL